jgi:hypothetical protein
MGPCWEPYTLVDLVVRLTAPDVAVRLVRIPRQRIERTE